MSQAAWRTRCDAYLDAHVLHNSSNTCSPSPSQVKQEALDTSLELLLQRIPKVDLHCHLNGSISQSLLAHLERLKQCAQTTTDQPSVVSSDYAIAEAEKVITAAECRTPAERMHACFATFDRIYGLMDNLAFTRLAVQDLLFCSAAECILVLEIRTSLRDGLRANWTSTSTSSTSDNSEDNVTKEDYLRTVCTTVEHLLAGGVVDFRTGTLLTLQDTTYSESDACQRTWWEDFTHIYHFLLPFLSEKRKVIDKACPSTLSSLYKQLFAQLQRRLQESMHVRLLVSINRGQSGEVAYEAVKLARHLQRTQVHAFYTWCTRQYDAILHAEESESREVVHTGKMCRRLRHTCWLTGVDFSGNCYKNHFNDFVPALRAVRDAYDDIATQSSTPHTSTTNTECELPCSLAVTVHGAEKVDEDELRAMCDFAPDRWGHLVFADSNSLRELILQSYAPIELCMTSNLITCGHVGPRQHHIGPLLQHWWSIIDSNEVTKPITLVNVICRNECEGENDEDSHAAVNNTSGYACTERLRCARRLWRWQNQKNTFSITSSTQCSLALPNVSFHTDDRGVFASTLSHELSLLAQHPRFSAHNEETNNVESSSMRDVLMTMWALQRLALLQVFELPWPALLLAHWLHKAVRDSNSRTEEEEENAEEIEIVLNKAFPATWADFVSYCHTLCDASHGGTSSGNSALLVQLSRWEWQWLTRGFDTYA